MNCCGGGLRCLFGLVVVVVIGVINVAIVVIVVDRFLLSCACESSSFVRFDVNSF